MTWVRGVDTTGIYKLDLGFNVFAYMQAKDEGQMGDIYETDLYLQQKQALAEEEPRAASLDSLEANRIEKMLDEVSLSLLSSSIVSEEKVPIDTPTQLEVSSLHDGPWVFSFSNTIPSF